MIFENYYFLNKLPKATTLRNIATSIACCSTGVVEAKPVVLYRFLWWWFIKAFRQTLYVIKDLCRRRQNVRFNK